MKSYCQFFEDQFALNFVNKVLNKSKGFYVDVGANDGITGSNTYLLEESGWDGILIEPNPELKEELSRNRPNTKKEFKAISTLSEVSFNSVEGEGNLHGLSRIDSNSDFIEHVEHHGGKVNQHSIPCRRLDELLAELNAPKDFDFLSIDVEGHELNVLQSMDFEKFKPQLICIEDNSKGECRVIQDFLQRKNYVYIARTGVNDWYTLPQYQKHFTWQRLQALYTKKRWQLKTKFYRLLKIKKNKSHI